MVKQFLLNADGSIPDGIDIDALNAAGIPLVIPSERWIPDEGFMIIEIDPELGDDGIWRQRWAEVPQEITVSDG